MMTKKEVQQKIEYHIKKAMEYKKELERMSMVLDLKGEMDKPFNKYDMQEMNQLLTMNEKAFNWLNQNKEKNIYDWNYLMGETEQVPLAR